MYIIFTGNIAHIIFFVKYIKKLHFTLKSICNIHLHIMDFLSHGIWYSLWTNMYFTYFLLHFHSLSRFYLNFNQNTKIVSVSTAWSCFSPFNMLGLLCNSLYLGLWPLCHQLPGLISPLIPTQLTVRNKRVG